MMEPVMVQFGEGHVVIEYVSLPEDIRDNGVQVGRRIVVPELVATVDELEALRRAAQLALKAGLRALEESQPVSMEELQGKDPDEVDPDVAGPYDNPEERP